MKKIATAACALLLALLTAACGAPTVGDVGPSQAFFAMDTLMTISLAEGTDDDLTAAVQLINELDAALTRSQGDSPISLVNAAAGSGTLTYVPEETYDAVCRALELAERTKGAFDPTVAPLLDLWGFSGSSPAVPQESAMDALLPLVDWQSVACTQTPDGCGILLQQAGMGLDLGGIGKGYAAGKVTQLLKERGVTSALLDLGGNVTALGSKKDGGSWNIAVQDPRNDNAYLCIFPLEDATASTSGAYERFFEENGIRYGHILDPETGCPADSGLLSVTVVCADPAVADALSTALFVMGAEDALDFWRESDDFECILISDDGTVQVTEGLAQNMQFQGESQGYHCEIVRR